MIVKQQLHINGAVREVEASPGESLLTVLREGLDLTGTHYGCGESQCGACTVLVDGEVTRSCITPIESVSGREITTIEGLAVGDKLHPVQEQFLHHDAFQCGYCTPGMIMAAVGLLHQNPSPTEAEIVRQMQPNVCRCGTYRRIISAIQAAAEDLRRAAK
jgi:aerobic-type carbon monoxide dehydrogenase small subunit (CoxS/CutS family)